MRMSDDSRHLQYRHSGVTSVFFASARLSGARFSPLHGTDAVTVCRSRRAVQNGRVGREHSGAAGGGQMCL